MTFDNGKTTLVVMHHETWPELADSLSFLILAIISEIAIVGSRKSNVKDACRNCDRQLQINVSYDFVLLMFLFFIIYLLHINKSSLIFWDD